MKKNLLWLFLAVLCPCTMLFAQPKLSVEGNGLFTSPASTNVDIKNTDDNTNALIRFGDNNLLKSSLGFNGNDDAFKISMGTTLGREDLTISETGRIGINNLPTDHRFFIRHNSTSGTNGSAHLTLQENSTGDFARLRFQNAGDDGLWTIATRTAGANALMNFFHNDGANFANILSLDGNQFRVGIHETSPEAYLHIKQDVQGQDALIFENDDQTGGEIWSYQIGDEDLDLYFEGVIRGSFSAATGAYTAFPPPAPLKGQREFRDRVLEKVLQLQPVVFSQEKNRGQTLGLNPEDVERVNPDWVVRSEDGERLGFNYQQFTVLAIKAIQEQQILIDDRAEEIAALEAEEAAFEKRLAQIEAKLAEMQPANEKQPGMPAAASAAAHSQAALRLQQNIPNPFREETLIELSIPASAQRAEVQLTDSRGSVVKNYRLAAGQNQLKVQAVGLRSGTYFYSLIVDGELIETKQMVIAK